jgi:hypothetical protein
MAVWMRFLHYDMCEINDDMLHAMPVECEV